MKSDLEIAAGVPCRPIPQIAADPVAAAQALREKFACHAVLKSAVSVICAADGALAVNAVDAPALAKGGSGDALAGILASLLSAVPLFFQGELWPWQLLVTAVTVTISLIIPGHLFRRYVRSNRIA